jgi:hypothetical protein
VQCTAKMMCHLVLGRAYDFILEGTAVGSFCSLTFVVASCALVELS